MKRWNFAAVLCVLVLMLAACGNKDDNANKDKQTDEPAMSNSTGENKDTSMEMEHEDAGDLPAGLEVAKEPKYKPGTTITVDSDHMKGMKGAEGKVAGAYNTIAYAVDYKPTNGGDEVKNHKWIVQEEIKGAGDKQLEPRKKVTLEADHMKGMKGAKATIVSGKQTTVYMIDYKPTNGGKKVKNHKWVTEEEIK